MPQVHPRISSSDLGISVSIGRDDNFSELNSPSTFTVWKKSLLFNGSGLTAFDSSGNVVMRVENYASQPKHHLFLMDAVGNTVFTLRHKRLSFKDTWEAFRGDGHGSGIKPVFSVIKTAWRLISRKPSAIVVLNPLKGQKKKLWHYRIEGSFCKLRSSFTVFSASGAIVAQATRKQATSKIMLGEDVLSFLVQPGIDQTLALTLFIIFNKVFKM